MFQQGDHAVNFVGTLDHDFKDKDMESHLFGDSVFFYSKDALVEDGFLFEDDSLRFSFFVKKMNYR